MAVPITFFFEKKKKNRISIINVEAIYEHLKYIETIRNIHLG